MAQPSSMRFRVPLKDSRTAAVALAASACPTATAWTIYSHLRFGEARVQIGPGVLPAVPKSALYCCGDADTTQTNSSLACVDGNPTFTLPNATPLLGVAGLSNAQVTSTNSTNSTSDTSVTAPPSASTTAHNGDCASQKQDTITVGSVLGVSLVAVAVALIVWAVWERRQKVLWWQRAIGLAPQWPPENATWMRAPSQNSKPPPCPVTRAKLVYAAHQQQKRAQEQQPAEQPAPTYGAHQPGTCQPGYQQQMTQNQVSSPDRPREMPDGMPAAAEMDAT